MSTFNGVLSEFPDIRIDFFRRYGDAPPPLACFLSHVHSDHLAGLESLRSPFVYCSAATREILLRLERYPCRINYAKGILEASKQTYKHLAKVLKPLPLDTPTTVELRPGHRIQVTLFDANHCPGAVMFLIEGNGKAILYTGDIRSEPWFVNSIARSPVLLEYTSGIKTLDKVYLDTSFIDDIPFQTKAEGIAELLRKVSQYPDDTVFHIQAWTYGYEDVWVALSKALKSTIHVDDYKLRIYGSLKAHPSEARFSRDYHLTPESPALVGYMCGNAPHPGCLTSDETVRLHSCEKGNMCKVARDPSTVMIQPIIAHLANGDDLAEAGVGGGGDDLQREAELDFLDQLDLSALLDLLVSSDDLSPEARDSLRGVLTQAISTGRSIHLNQDISSIEGEQSVQKAVAQIIKMAMATSKQQISEDNQPEQVDLPKIIRFPYSRHSSYSELCQLVDAFQPKDVWPCTVNPVEWLKEGLSIESLFGRFCSGTEFNHDIYMQEFVQRQGLMDRANSQTMTDSIPRTPPPTSPRISDNTPSSRKAHSSPLSLRGPAKFLSPLPETQHCANIEEIQVEAGAKVDLTIMPMLATSSQHKRSFDAFAGDGLSDPGLEHGASFEGTGAFTSITATPNSTARQLAYHQMLDNVTSDTWSPIALISASDHHTIMDKEL
ncbi:artemis protein [Dactylonectria estremocensis]|uniref:Protein artemis n=1 Tax=Dactylonectria estremocensis TaxID=1079267 RepID=A0A9P9IR09_9HYPO|nr:artemis protein [Dactylonectria estremocensis]